MERSARHSKILELISKKDIETQFELTQQLKKVGFDVTQATVSRDVKDLGLIKTISANNKYRYIYPNINDQQSKLLNIFRESVISIDTAINLIVLKTISGSANSACVIIDKLNIDGIVGTIAGDDTILIIVKTMEKVINVQNELQNMLNRK